MDNIKDLIFSGAESLIVNAINNLGFIGMILLAMALCVVGLTQKPR